MRYIRFLKVPKIQGKSINAVVTITSDLGETFLAEDAFLSATLRSSDPDGDIYLRKSLRWKGGMRALPLSFEAENCDLDWPVRVHVSVKNAPQLDCFEKQYNAAGLPGIISAWSDILDPPRNIREASRTVERRFTPLSGRTLSMWEETGESIARHLWCVVCYTRSLGRAHNSPGTGASR
jgi:hypothetical protein